MSCAAGVLSAPNTQRYDVHCYSRNPFLCSCDRRALRPFAGAMPSSWGSPEPRWRFRCEAALTV